MKKLMIGAVVLATAGFAVAGPAFTLPAVIAQVDNAADATVTVVVGAEGTGGVQGLNFYLQTDAPLEIVDLSIDGPGTMFALNTSGATIGTFLNGGSPTPQIALGIVTTSSGTVDASMGAAGIAQVKIPAGTAMGDYVVKTEVPDFGVASDWAGDPAAGQAMGVIRVIPEPMSALLLLAGLPLLRRRTA